ncbi:MAG TPA: hypothetical protein VLX92_02275 [Kofleriaceae bacterium]|nr:hypothetical protein [Kofleriaceae bacterium]
MRIWLASAALAAGATAAQAGPLTIGASLGVFQSDANTGSESTGTETVFARLGITRGLAAALEVQRIDAIGGDLRAATGLVVLDLGGTHLVPILLAGGGFDWLTDSYGGETDAHHLEAGLGLEYRSRGGFVIGIDYRVGQLAVDAPMTEPIRPILNCCTLGVPEPSLSNGTYQSARVSAGVRF